MSAPPTDDWFTAFSPDAPAELGGNPPVGVPAVGGLRPAELDQIVDVVVERIEQRVVDELERRGRRHDFGVI